MRENYEFDSTIGLLALTLPKVGCFLYNMLLFLNGKDGVNIEQ